MDRIALDKSLNQEYNNILQVLEKNLHMKE